MTAIKRTYEVYDRNGNILLRTSRENDLSIKGAGDGIEWNENPGDGAPYTIFCEEHGPIGYVGTSDCTGFLNDNIEPDYSCRPWNIQFEGKIPTHA